MDLSVRSIATNGLRIKDVFALAGTSDLRTNVDRAKIFFNTLLYAGTVS
jgi:hypothetical protein